MDQVASASCTDPIQVQLATFEAKLSIVLIVNNTFLTCLEAAAGIEPAIEVLQTCALPLGYAASKGGSS